MEKKRGSIKYRKKELKINGHSNEEITEIINNHKQRILPKNQRKLEQISKSIIPIFPEELNGRKYLHYCTYYQHPGIIGEKHFEKKDCISKECNHYQRFFLE
jgi:hypothetical protein